MGGSAAITAEEQSFQFYSAKAEIDDFMRRFLSFTKPDNATARTTSKAVLRERSLTSSSLTDALEKLDVLCSRLDVEATNVVQMEIQNEALRSLHDESVRQHARTLQEFRRVNLELESRCTDLELRLRVATSTAIGGRLGAAKLTRVLKNEVRVLRRRRRLARSVGVAPFAACPDAKRGAVDG